MPTRACCWPSRPPPTWAWHPGTPSRSPSPAGPRRRCRSTASSTCPTPTPCSRRSGRRRAPSPPRRRTTSSCSPRAAGRTCSPRWPRRPPPRTASPRRSTSPARARWPPTPAAAYVQETGSARNLEAGSAGTAVVGDNLGAALDAARSDAAYAQVLFLFLGLPGAVLAALVTVAVAGAGASRRRREQALARVRGAGTAQILRLAAVEALLVGAGGALAGLAVGAAVGGSAFAAPAPGVAAPAAGAWAGWATAAALAGFVVAALSVVAPAWLDLRRATVSAARRTVDPPALADRSPWWARIGLDVALLVGGCAPGPGSHRHGLRAGPRPRGRTDRLGVLLGVRRARAAVGRFRAAGVAADRPRPAPAATAPVGGASGGRRVVLDRGRDDEPQAPPPRPVRRPARAGAGVRRVDRDVQRDLPGPGRGRRAADQRCRRRGDRARGVPGRTRRRRHARPGAGGAGGGTAAAPLRLHRHGPAGPLRRAAGLDHRRHGPAGRVLLRAAPPARSWTGSPRPRTRSS